MKYDLHIHSCLSACADSDMTPNNIAGMAHLENLEVIAIADHNSAKNLQGALKKCKEYNIKLLYALEVTSSEDVHLVCYFNNLENCTSFSDEIYTLIPKIPNRIGIYNPQNVLDENEKTIYTEPYLLSVACSLSVSEVVNLVHFYKGLCYYAHIDKNTNSIINILGDVPSDVNIDGFEMINLDLLEEYILKYPNLKNLDYLQNTDAHSLYLIGENNKFLSEKSSLYNYIKTIK